MNYLPKFIHHPSRSKSADQLIHFSPILAEVAQLEDESVFSRMNTTPAGLSDTEANRRLTEAGPNVVATSARHGWPLRLLTAMRNPLVILLAVL